MKLIHCSDIHLDERDRYDETMDVLEWIVQEAADFKPDVIIVAGDSAPVSVRQMTPKERNGLAYIYDKLASWAPVVVLRGNHDVLDGDIDIFGKLTCHIITASQPTVTEIKEGLVV